MARKVSMIVAVCFLLFSGIWFTLVPLLLSLVITQPKELIRFGGIESTVYIGFTSLLIYFAVQMTIRVCVINNKMHSSEEDLLKRLGQAAEWRDDETSEHTMRVGEYCELLARGLNWKPVDCERIRKAGMLHDIGKIGIPDFVMTKKEEFTDDDRSLMQAHTLMGSDLLSDSEVPMIQMAQSIAASHHERWDGKGYPYGLQGENIPIEGRIAAVADVFDALTSRRRYKDAWTIDDAIVEIQNASGTQFDPKIVDVFIQNIEQFKLVHEKYASTANMIKISRAA